MDSIHVYLAKCVYDSCSGVNSMSFSLDFCNLGLDTHLGTQIIAVWLGKEEQ